MKCFSLVSVPLEDGWTDFVNYFYFRNSPSNLLRGNKYSSEGTPTSVWMKPRAPVRT